MDWNAVREALLDSTTALFENYGIALSHVKPSMPSQLGEATLAVIGFTSAEFNGSLVVSMATTLLADSYPKLEGVEPDLYGWAGELANQLTGRVKNKLLSRGIVLSLSIPTTISGRGVHIGAARRNAQLFENTVWYRDSPVLVRLEAVPRAIAPGEVRPETSLEEGEMQLF